jgi:hypothetical protein
VHFSLISSVAFAGNVFLSGHDPDYHATVGENSVGAQNLMRKSLAFARDGNSAPILVLQSNTDNILLGAHADSELGLIASGYTAGTGSGDTYVKVNATEFATTDLSQYSAIFVPSDYGGCLTGNDLAALNARSADIAEYIYAGGGLVALAENGIRQPATVGPEPLNFGFLPFSVMASSLDQNEVGFTLTPFGESLGLTVADITGNNMQNFFLDTNGLQVVDFDSEGRIITLAGALIPEPKSMSLFIVGMSFAGLAARRRVS